MKQPIWIAVCALLGCASSEPPGELPPSSGAAGLTAADLARPWVALSVPRALEAPHIVRDARGFVALSRELTGGKVIGPTYNYLYRSDDGISWRRLPLPEKTDYFGLRDLGHGGGRYVMVGSSGDKNEIWTSTDLAAWSKQPIELGGGNLWRVRNVNGRFFAFSTFRDFLVSQDGAAWSVIPSLTLQQQDVAFGKDLFVLVGVGPIRTSRDARTWQDHALDCQLPGACIQDPSGGIHQALHAGVLFAHDRFYVDELVSSDGVAWQVHGAPRASAFVGGYFLGARTESGLQAWRPGEAPATIAVTTGPAVAPLAGGAGPDTIVAALPGGETCLTHRCLLVDETLFLIR
jgi:hypothetical protein